jgi:formate-dependent nitrite reductase membrane component NrfD
MPEDITSHHHPDEPPAVPQDTTPGRGGWQGPTYYGRSQLKAAPFGTWVVGGYIFLAGLAGSAAIISTLLDATRGETAAPAVRRGRYLSLLAPTLGAALLVWDLHTPKRFYNMLRVAKRTSPMSIGTWVLVNFSIFAGAGAVAQFLSDRAPGLRWLRRAAQVTQVPGAVAGAGLSTYTASLLSATSTPLWAAAPKGLAVRFAASSVAAGASALSLGERSGVIRRRLDAVTLAALAAELAATTASHRVYQQTGVAEAFDGSWGKVENWGATKLGVVAPLALHGVSLLLTPRKALNSSAERSSPALSGLASLAALAGSLLLRVSIMGAGDESATRPDISFRFSQPKNLPRRESNAES